MLQAGNAQWWVPWNACLNPDDAVSSIHGEHATILQPSAMAGLQQPARQANAITLFSRLLLNALSITLITFNPSLASTGSGAPAVMASYMP